MTRKIRVGAIGTSGWADFMYLSSLRSHPQAELAAICGRNRARAGELAAKYNIPQVYTDYAAMMAQAGLDAVIVGAPGHANFLRWVQGPASDRRGLGSGQVRQVGKHTRPGLATIPSRFGVKA